MAPREDGPDAIDAGEGIDRTADHADDYLRRVMLWDKIRAIFRDEMPTEADLSRVSVLAEVAIDQVFQAHHLTEAEQIARHGEVKDFAECAGLYGFVLGLHYGQRRARMAGMFLAGD